MYYATENEGPAGEIERRSFGRVRRAALDFARRKSQSVGGLVYVLVDADDAKPLGQIVYAYGFRDYVDAANGDPRSLQESAR